MVDDLSPARPQSGFAAASVVWQAPAEGGIPRYMMMFQDQVPGNVGPVRSARLYFVLWAAEWNAVYAHVGGSPQALARLRKDGRRQARLRRRRVPIRSALLLADQDTLRTAQHVHQRQPTATDLQDVRGRRQADDVSPGRSRSMHLSTSARSGAGSSSRTSPTRSAMTTTESRTLICEPSRRKASRRTEIPALGSRRRTSSSCSCASGPLNDGSPKHRLEANLVGKGTAWIATNGKTIKGTWRKKSDSDPTRFYDGKGKPVTLTVGQTFVQVMPTGTPVSIKNGASPPSHHLATLGQSRSPGLTAAR